MPLPSHLLGYSGGGRLALDSVQHFQREVVAARSEVADRAADQVVSNNGGNCGGQSGGGCNQGLGNSWRYGTQGRRTAGSQPVKGVNDAPYRAEKPYKRRDRAGNGQPRQVTLEAGHFFGRCNLHGPLYSQRISQSSGGAHLALEFAITCMKHSDQRTGPELFGDRVNVL